MQANSVAVQIPFTKVTNEILAKAQTALKEMGLFPGKVDGYYGPLTAAAIRAFELQQGLAPKGAMSVQIISEIISFSVPQNSLATPSVPVANQAANQVQPSTSPQSRPVEQPHVEDAPVPDLLASIASSVAQNQPQVIPQSLPTASSQPAVVVASPPDKAMIEKIQRGLSDRKSVV